MKEYLTVVNKLCARGEWAFVSVLKAQSASERRVILFQAFQAAFGAGDDEGAKAMAEALLEADRDWVFEPAIVESESLVGPSRFNDDVPEDADVLEDAAREASVRRLCALYLLLPSSQNVPRPGMYPVDVVAFPLTKEWVFERMLEFWLAITDQLRAERVLSEMAALPIALSLDAPAFERAFKKVVNSAVPAGRLFDAFVHLAESITLDDPAAGVLGLQHADELPVRTLARHLFQAWARNGSVMDAVRMVRLYTPVCGLFPEAYAHVQKYAERVAEVARVRNTLVEWLKKGEVIQDGSGSEARWNGGELTFEVHPIRADALERIEITITAVYVCEPAANTESRLADRVYACAALQRWVGEHEGFRVAGKIVHRYRLPGRGFHQNIFEAPLAFPVSS